MITIGISSYNQQEYLPEAIESALNQTLKCEVIVVNDGSTDNSLEIARRYPVKVVNQVNKGLPSARNTAILNMAGDYLLPLDADDILYFECAEKIQKVIDETGADIIAPSLKCFGLGNETIILDKHPTIADFRTANRIGYFSAIKKEALLECGGYSPRMVEGYEDYHLWINLLTLGKKIETIQEPLVFYRTKSVSMWREASKPETHIRLMRQIFKDFPSAWPLEMQEELANKKV